MSSIALVEGELAGADRHDDPVLARRQRTALAAGRHLANSRLSGGKLPTGASMIRGGGTVTKQQLPLDFALDDESGRPWRLSAHLGDSVVLLFLRGDW